MTTAANRPPQSPVYCMATSTLFRPGPTDMFFSEDAKISDRKYSFQMPMKLKIPTVMMPGCTSGNMMVQKVRMGGQPSMAAASSYTRDKLAKKVMRNVVV